MCFSIVHYVAVSCACSVVFPAFCYRTSSYLTFLSGEDVLPPSTEASNGPNAHPRINHEVTKSPSVVLTNNGTIPLSR